ncbi:cytochrome c oxidase subunit I [Ignavibacteria bacterium]|nr:cbb3-type cytochrome c oxidase subunit I [Bacteroidota bacterium]
MIQLSFEEQKGQRKFVVAWSITFLVLFPVLIALGLLMRLNQGEIIAMQPTTFYAIMTLHGLGMAGVLFSMSFAGLWYLIGTRYTKLSLGMGYFVFALTLAGVIGLTVATLIGNYAPGWYLLYPLPFVGTSWEEWSNGMAIISLIILGVAWIIGSSHIVSALAKEYDGAFNLLGWQYLGKKEVKREVPPIAMITTISLIAGVMSFLIGAVFLLLLLLKYFEPSLSFDPLLLKNYVFFFGHTLVNITLYCCLGWVYELLPEFTGREWKTNKVLVYSWNCTFFFILFAYFHHLYMDFAQPMIFNYFGQIASFSSSVPASAITMFGIIAQFYHSKTKWGIIPTAFLLGVAGWAIGGFAAVVDSAIAVNKILHNTMWVPAHFHTYMLCGVVLFILGFLFYITHSKAEQERNKPAKIGLWLFITGSAGFLSMFYMGGLNSIPRRYADYASSPIASTHDTGALLAYIAAIFIVLILVGLLTMYASIIFRLGADKRETL